ncbi:MAG: TrbC family F-type conjugative pilus assembly protein [bacterium]
MGVQFALAEGTPAPTPADREALAKTAREKGEEAAAGVVTLKPADYPDPARLEALARQAIARCKAAFASLMKQYAPAATESIDDQDASGADGAAAAPKRAPLAGRLVVALSSSMPDTMLRDYLRQLDGIPEGIVVLRGFIGGAHLVKPTGVWLEQIRRKEPDCMRCPHWKVEVVVDPIAYRMLDIHQVPAVAYLPGVQDLKHCDAETLTTPAIAYGAASLKSALERLATDGVNVPPGLLQRLGKRT